VGKENQEGYFAANTTSEHVVAEGAVYDEPVIDTESGCGLKVIGKQVK
jgi:hypothetical protein